ncbi:MAG: hypothetical protein R2856_32440 [Caldilineaceae bacterium]
MIDLLADGGMTIFSNSHVSLIATDFEDRQPWPRGITRVRQLLDAGVPVACGQDDVDNWFYPFGRNDMLEVAQFMAHNGRFAWNSEVDRVLPMITETSRRRCWAWAITACTSAQRPISSSSMRRTGTAPSMEFQAAKRYVVLRGGGGCRGRRNNVYAYNQRKNDPRRHTKIHEEGRKNRQKAFSLYRPDNPEIRVPHFSSSWCFVCLRGS